MDRMERTVLMMHHEQRAKLSRLATQEHVSAAEINRRAIDAYNPSKKETTGDAEIGYGICDDASKTKAILDAQKAVKETLLYFQKKHKKADG